jgi:NADPH-dependent glutamate synthase beta subunit-like oxidoreductase
VQCPAHNNVQAYVSLASRGKFREAIQVIKQTSPFPSVCGRACPHPCEADCNRDDIDAPVAIRAIERFVADQDRSSNHPYVPEVREARDDKVAVFEKLPVAGGMMAVGIPDYRLPKEVLSDEIGLIENMGVDIRTRVTFGSDITLESLRQAGYQAIFLATGLHKNGRLNVENEDVDGVLKGIDFLRDVILGNPVSVGNRVIVVGGGNVAIDVGMTALRKGAQQVTVVCLEDRREMPAWEHEIQTALEEGIEIVNCFGPNRFLQEDGRFSGIEFKRCTCVFDEDGTFNPEYDETDLTELEGDTVIVAISQVADISLAEAQGIPVTSAGWFDADPVTLETPIRGVFAGGDAYHGPGSVAQAIGSGRQAAVSIDRYIKGLDLQVGRLGRDKALRAITAPQKERYDPSVRALMPRLDVEERINNFDEIEKGFSEQMVVQEGKRCIMCGASCVQACPYDVMQFNHETLKAVKCDLCVDKRGRDEAPACTVVCPTQCIYWGDPETLPVRAETVP